jgi:hypothetical protein
VSRKNAPRGKLLKLAPGVADLAQAAVLVPESDAVILSGDQTGGEPVAVTSRAVYVREITGGPSRVAIFDHAGKPRGTLPLPDLATVDEVEPLSDGTLLYSIATYLRPPFFSRYDEAAARTSETKLAQTSPVSFADTEVVREFARSKDGTSIPLNIVRRKGVVLNGSNPVLLNGYGGYNVSETPEFLGARTRLWQCPVHPRESVRRCVRLPIRSARNAAAGLGQPIHSESISSRVSVHPDPGSGPADPCVASISPRIERVPPGMQPLTINQCCVPSIP